MSSELTVYGRVADPLAFMREFGTEIAQSRMFGCANEAQGKVLAMACLCEGANPIQLARKYHIIENNLSMKADAMLAELRARGGKHKVIERTADKAIVEIHYDGQVYVETLTWEDAQQERYVYDKQGNVKPNYATPRSRRQMLWARVISEAVRTVAPEIVSGIYTPEESQDVIAEPTATRTVDAEALIRAATADAIDAEVEPAVDEPHPESNGKCVAEQRAQIRNLFTLLGASLEQQEKALEKRGVKAIRWLTVEQADELIATMTARAQSVAGKSRLPDETRTADSTSPVEETIVAEIKSLLGDNLDLMKRVKEHLVKHGCQKIAQLAHEDAERLLESLKMDTIETFFARDLVPF